MYFGAASRRACWRAVVAGARAGCICVRVQSQFRMHRCVCHAHAGVHAWSLCMASARLTPHSSVVACRARPHASAVHGRYIAYTKVKALPESLGQCKLLQTLCVPRPPPPPPCAFAAVPALRCCAWRFRAGAPGLTARRRMRRRRRCRSSAAVEPHARMAGARGRPARVWGWAGAARRGCTVGAQDRFQHRARGTAGGGRVAEVEGTVSALAAALTRHRCMYNTNTHTPTHRHKHI